MSTTSSAAPGDYTSAEHDCDLVMKGGITSGIVYPPAVLRLARKYCFRSVGGTSAGAIAAAATAAAELGRGTGGFEKLGALTGKLQEPGFLLNLFQPTPATRPLFDLALAWTAESAPPDQAGGAAPTRPHGGKLALLGRAHRLLRTHVPGAREGAWRGLAGGIGAGLLLGLLAWAAARLAGSGNALPGAALFAGVMALLLALLGEWLGTFAGGSAELTAVLTKRMPEGGFFGMCTGRSQGTGHPALTDWLTNRIDDLAGRPTGESAVDRADDPADPPPLTFGDLEADAKRAVKLRMVTSNLSEQQPYTLPGIAEGGTFIFNEAEMHRLFPQRVVKHMVATAKKSARVRLPDGFHYLPEPRNLPVVVATRMSLSFPLLITAVPLHTVRRSFFAGHKHHEVVEPRPSDLQRHWFSDGGIASNFPIHMFDAWLPSRPTFGISLASLPEDAFSPGGPREGGARVSDRYRTAAAADLEATGARAAGAPPAGSTDPSIAGAVSMPAANRPQAPLWTPLGTLGGFLWSVFATAQNYRDNAQQALPGYRDRVVTVALSDAEGGLNLAMPDTTIERVVKKGEAAGERILSQFDFEHHRWVRLLVLGAELESRLLKMRRTIGEGFDIGKLMDAQAADQNFPYNRDREWCERARTRMEEIVALVDGWGETRAFEKAVPKPTAGLRIVPES